MTPDYPLSDSRFEYHGSLSTNISERFRKEGFAPPEQAAAEQEREARIEAAKRVLTRIQSCTEPVRTPLYLLSMLNRGPTNG